MNSTSHARSIRDVKRVPHVSVFLMGAAAASAALGFAHLASTAMLNSVGYEAVLGKALWGEAGVQGWWLGLFSWLALGSLIGFVYSVVFRSARRSGAGVGLTVCLYHLALSLIAMAFFSMYVGVDWDFASAVIFVLMHPLFGAVFGVLFDRAAAREEYPKPIISNSWR